MPWEAHTMSETRLAFVALVRSKRSTMADACRHYGISRKTGYKWLRRFQLDPERPPRRWATCPRPPAGVPALGLVPRNCPP